MRRELPDGWKAMCERVGISGSARGIAAAAGLAITTVQRLVFEGRTSEATVAAVAAALRVDRQAVKKAAGIAGDKPDWYPPSEAQRLSPKTQEALDRLILAIAEEVSDGRRPDAEKTSDGQHEPGRQEGGNGDDGQSEDQKNQRGGGEVAEFPKQQQAVDQGLPVEEAAYDLPLDLPPDDEDVSQDPDDWGNDE